MKQLDFDRAFPQTPDCIHAAIEMGFRKGQKKMKMRNKIITFGSIAAALAIMFAAALATGGLNLSPQPDVLAQPPVTDVPKATEDSMFWCTEKGNYYHSEEHCSGMEGAIYGTLSYALALDKQPCPVCIDTSAIVLMPTTAPAPEENTAANESATDSMPEAEEYVLMNAEEKASQTSMDIVYVEYGADGNSYHRLQNCGSREYLREITESQAKKENFPPCSACYFGYVFYTEDGKFYHSNEHCQAMLNAKTHTRKQADSDNKMPCPVCLNVYCTEGGTYFHTQEKCTGMLDADLVAENDALDMGKQRCSICWYSYPVYATYGASRYYHNVAVCNGQENKRELTLAEADMENLDPCPDCYAATAAEANAEESNVVFYRTPNGKYYHYEPDCSGMMNAEACTPEKAIVNTGKHACPVCFNTEEKKALYMLPVPWSDADEVYVAVDNDYYHIDPDCFNMVMVSKMDLKSAKGFDKTVCPVCMKEYSDFTSDEQETCWATRNGKYYHSDQYCSGMEHAVSGPVVEAQAMGKLRCPICIELDLEDYDLFTTAFGQDISDLYYGYNYDHSVGNEWIISNGTESFRLCEVYSEGMTFFGDEPPGIPELHLNGLTADPEQVHVFMKNAPAPIGSMYAAAPAEVERLAYKGNLTTEEVQLQEVVVYFDANRQVSSCEMQFGFYDHVKLSWKVGADGQIEMTESELVRPGWDESSAEAPEETAVEVSTFTSPLPDESTLPFLGTTTLLDLLYQSAFGNLEEASAAAYGFMQAEDAVALGYYFDPEEYGNSWLFTDGRTPVLNLYLQEADNDSNLKYIMNVELYGIQGDSKRFMESVAAQPLVDLYPQAVALAREHLASTHKEDAEDFNPYVEKMMIGFDETYWPNVIQLDFRRKSGSDEVFGVEFTMVDGSHDNWKSRIIV